MIGLDYGTPIPVEKGFDPGNLDRSYLNVPNTKDSRAFNPFHNYPLWHPDGKRIYYEVSE